jgi:hypothetical protein
MSAIPSVSQTPHAQATRPRTEAPKPLEPTPASPAVRSREQAPVAVAKTAPAPKHTVDVKA